MKVKITRVRGGSMGDQRQYGLVTGSVWNYEDKKTTNNVGTTLSPVPRDEATIEAERGETVVGDLDNDGMVEHAKIGGKRHPQGGTPLNVPDGSFVFSDYRGLLIKNKDMLKDIFNMSTSKAVTPAKVAQRYDINRYKALLNDPESDAFTKKTAQMMIDNNMKKLGQLALVQEGMKGFPDGIPAIAMPLLGSDIAQQGGQQKMKKGGIVNYKKGGLTRYDEGKQVGKWVQYPGDSNKYQQLTLEDLQTKIGHELQPIGYEPGVGYIFQDPGNMSIPTGIRRPGQMWIQDENTGNVSMTSGPAEVSYEKTPEDRMRIITQNDPNFKYWTDPNNRGYMLDQWQPGAQPVYQPIGSDPGLLGYLTTGAIIGGGGYLAAKNIPWKAGWDKLLKWGPRAWQATKNAAQMVSRVPGGTPLLWSLGTSGGLYGINEASKLWRSGEGWFDDPKDNYVLRDSMNAAVPDTGKAPIPTVFPTDSNAILNADTSKMIDFIRKEYPNETPESILEQMRTIPSGQLDTVLTQMGYYGDEAREKLLKGTVVTDAEKAATSDKKETVQNQNQNQKTADKSVKKQGTIKVKNAGNAVKLNTDSILQFKSKKFGGDLNQYRTGNQTFTQYTPQSQITSNDDYDVIPVGQDIGYGFTVQKYDPSKGYYTITNPDTGQTIELDLNDFMTRQGELVDAYNGGRNQWLKDATSSNEAIRKKAVHHFQTEYDKWRVANNLPTYFYGNPDANPYGVDDKFGIYTFSAPGIKKKVKQQKVEEKKQEEVTPEEEIVTPKPQFQGATGYNIGQFFPSDIAAMHAAASQIIPKYKAYSAYANPALMSPVYKNENYEPISAATQTIEGLGTGPEARGSALGVTGKGLKTASDITAQTQALNLQQFLQTQGANVPTINQFKLRNLDETGKYIDSLNAFTNATAKGMNEKTAQLAKTYGKGYLNAYNQMLTNAQYPYQFQTPYSIAVNPTLKSIYDTPITGGGSGTSYDDVFDYYHKLYSRPDSGLSKKEAIDAANNSARNHLNSIYQRNRGTGTGGAALSPFIES